MSVARRRRGGRKSRSLGLAPGTMVHIGEDHSGPALISGLHYTADSLQPIESVQAALEAARQRRGVVWLNIDGVHDLQTIREAGEAFGLHALTLEDVTDTSQRPKVEEHEDYLFLILKMLDGGPSSKTVEAAGPGTIAGVPQAPPNAGVQIEQLSLVLGENWVLSFQEQSGDVFDAVRERIRSGRGQLRRMGSDYLAYALLDAVVDHYFVLLEHVGDELDGCEESLLTGHQEEASLPQVHSIRRDLLTMRRSIWPLRELMGILLRADSAHWKASTAVYLKDLYDHTIQVIDIVEDYRELTAGLREYATSLMSHRMNATMRVLTIIGTVFLPLTFLVGVYGMNFTHMPELQWRWAYPAVWVAMLAIAGGLILFFRRKRWL